MVVTLILVALAGCSAPAPSAALPGPDASSGLDAAAQAPLDAATPDAGAPDSSTPEPDAGAPDTGPAPIVSGSWCVARARASCSRRARCGELDAASRTLCEAVETSTCDQPTLTAALAAGRESFDGARAALCLDAFTAQCGTVTPRGPDCAASLRPLVSVGSPCVAAGECDQGFCDLADGQCPHRCKALFKTGEQCGAGGPGAPCVEGDWCDTHGTTCVVRPRDGEPCHEPYECDVGLFCSSAARCKPIPPLALEGAACGSDGLQPRCLLSLHCAFKGDGSPGTCQKRVGAGAACDSQGACRDLLYCNLQGVCEALPGRGESCQGSFLCAEGRCDGASYTCAALLGGGDACWAPADCQSQECPGATLTTAGKCTAACTGR